VEQDNNSLIKLKKVAGANRVYFLLFLPVVLTVHLVGCSAAYVVMVAALLFP
jgi:hypothetical protein